ncbi:hypothetical protein [Flavobacterium sp. YJ01]|uniref:hypothetical protein n=1 Tax=unclassified Flavobacterium TaxID=196869 RepID=UPI0023E3F5E3|nr:hypothetical protein [Flavobacterium sp. YJ01]WET04127.1 hypothetical protein P0R33_07235 [Flavobacterium sp. YJ01]
MQHIYQNDFGEIYNDKVRLIILNQKKTIHLKNISKIRFIKRKTYFSNYTALLIAIVFFNISNFTEKSGIVALIIFILTIICLNLKLRQHKIIIIRKNDFIKIDVEKKLSKDAENLINHLKQLHRL